MRFANPEGVASGLEEGLDEVRFCITLPEKPLRLSVGFCGLISTALQQCLREIGYGVRLAVTEPNLQYDTDMRHVMAVVAGDGGEHVVDATYTQFLRYAGLSPYYVQRGGDNLLPEAKIAIFPLGEHQPVAEHLATTALTFMAKHTVVDVPRPATGHYEFETIEPSQIRSDLLRIWEPSAMGLYVPSDATVDAASRVAAHVRLRDAVLIGEGI